jgi:hypothetical protein
MFATPNHTCLQHRDSTSAASKINICNIKKFESNFETFAWNTSNMWRTQMRHVHNDMQYKREMIASWKATIATCQELVATPVYNIRNIRKQHPQHRDLLFEHYNIETHPGHSVLPNRSVRFLGTSSKSVPSKVSTDRFQENVGTEVLRFFRFGFGKYRKNRTGDGDKATRGDGWGRRRGDARRRLGTAAMCGAAPDWCLSAAWGLQVGSSG